MLAGKLACLDMLGKLWGRNMSSGAQALVLLRIGSGLAAWAGAAVVRAGGGVGVGPELWLQELSSI